MDLLKNSSNSEAIKGRLQAVVQETESRASVFSQWYYLAIHTLASIPGIEISPQFMAKATGLSEEICDESIRFLLSMGMLTKANDGTIQYVAKYNEGAQSATMEGSEQNEIASQYIEQMLALNKKAIRSVPEHQKSMGSVVFAMNSSQFGVFQERLFTALHELLLEAKRGSKPEECDSVYSLTVLAIPLAKLQ